MAPKRSKLRIRGKGAAKGTASTVKKVKGGAVVAAPATISAHLARRVRIFNKSRGLGTGMAPKRSTMHLRGKDAPKATTTTVVNVEDGVVAAAPAPDSATFPADPQDRRLTLEGIVLDGKGKINISAYEDLAQAFENEPPPRLHPYPHLPGLRANEQIPKGLRVWDDLRQGHTDRDGAGWVAVLSKNAKEKKREKWFNIQYCGSWRMAFLMARLQLAYWHEQGANAVEPSTVTPQRRKEVTAQAKIPMKKKLGAQPEEPVTPSARKAPGKAPNRSGGSQEQTEPLTPKPMEHRPIVTSELLAMVVDTRSAEWYTTEEELLWRYARAVRLEKWTSELG